MVDSSPSLAPVTHCSSSSSSSSGSPTPPNSSDVPHEEQYGDVFRPLRPSTVLSLPEPESSNEVEELETGGLYPARKLLSFDFASTGEGTLLGNIHTRLAALRFTAVDAQIRYSQSINSSIPQDPALSRNVRMTVANALWNSTAFFEEEEAAAQLLRYREMFIYLSQRHAESLASSSLYQAHSLVRRGQISIAAIRLTGGRPQRVFGRSVAQGHHARHSSEVSIWGWKPWRENALAVKMSEQRRERVEKERDKEFYKRGKKSSGGKGVEFLSDYGCETIQDGYKINSSTRRHLTPQKTSMGRIKSVGKTVYHSDSGSTSIGQHANEDGPTDSSSLNSGQTSPKDYRPSTDGATSSEKLIFTSEMSSSDDSGPPGWAWSARPKAETIWRMPIYHDVGLPFPTIPLLDTRTGLEIPTIATVSNANDMFQRIHTIHEPSGMEYILTSSSLGPIISPQISPRSQVPPNVSSVNDESTMFADESSFFLPPETIASLSQQSSSSFTSALFELGKKPAVNPNDSSSDSTIGISHKRHLWKIRTVFKSFPLKKIHFPWSSSSEEEIQTEAHSSHDPSSSEQSWPLGSSIPSGYGLVPPPPKKDYPYIDYLGKSAPQTRIHSPHRHSPQHKIVRKKVPISSLRSPPHPGTKLARSTTLLSEISGTSQRVPTTRHQEGDPLTRTEKEYQELLKTLNELKRDMRSGWSRSRSRGRASDASVGEAMESESERRGRRLK